MKRLILDTQCVLSAISAARQGQNTTLAHLWRQFRRRELVLVLSETSLLELQRVLDYPSVARLGITSGMAFAAATDLLLLGEYHAPVPSHQWPSLSDPKDWFLLDLLYESGADALLTRDRQVLKAGAALGLPVYLPEMMAEVELFRET